MLSGTLLLPTITAKFLRKTSVLTAVASGSTNTRMIYKTATFYKRYYYYLSERVLELLTFNAATYIGVESPNVALFMNLPLNKVIGNGHLFFMDGNFRQTHNFANRPYCIGYVGRLSREKGVFNFVTALPDITLRCPDLHVTITGDGSLYSEIKTFLEQNELYKRVDFPGWISHDASLTTLTSSGSSSSPPTPRGSRTSCLRRCLAGPRCSRRRSGRYRML